MSKGILDASGKTVTPSANTLKRSQVPSPDMNLSCEEIAKLDFQPLGNWLLAEPVIPETKSDGGIYQYNLEYKPLFRIVRLGSIEYSSELLKNASLGDILYSSSTVAMRVFHTFPRVVLDPGDEEKRVAPVIEERMLVMMQYANFKGVIPGFRWTKEQAVQAERKVGTTMVDFQPDFIEAIMTKMATEEDAAKIDFIPLSDQIVVERTPTKTKEGRFYMVDVQEHMPFFRILKMPANPEILAPHLRKLRVGDLVQMNNVTEMDIYPTGLKNADGDNRRIYVASAGFISGFYPSLHWDHKPQPVALEDSVIVVEQK
jgi:hypothetical protein